MSEQRKVYVVYRTFEGQDLRPEATGQDVATFGTLQDAAAYCRKMEEMATQLRLLGVAFVNGAYIFRVKTMTYTDAGIRYGRVVLDKDTDDGADVEYETPPKELTS